MSRISHHSIAGLVVLVGVVAVAPRAQGYLTVYGMPISGPAGEDWLGAYANEGDSRPYETDTPRPRVGNGVAAAATFGYGSTWPYMGESYMTRWHASGASETAGAVQAGELPRGSVWDMNVSGTVVGNVAYFYGTGHSTAAARWDVGATTPTLLETFGPNIEGGLSSQARAINNAGYAIGWVERLNGEGNFAGAAIARWDPSGALTELHSPYAVPLNDVEGEAWGINDAGTVVGRVHVWDGGVKTGQIKGARWDAGGTMATVLNGLGEDGEQSAYAIAINNAGTVVGASVPTGLNHSWDTRAVRWDAGSTTATELEMLSPHDPQYICRTEAWLVSDSGMIAGMFTSKLPSDSRGSSSGVRWWPDGHAQELEGPGGTPLDMNAAGMIVGKSNSEEDEYGNLLSRAVLWGLDGKELDLNTLIDPALGWRLVSATSISDTGWVAGYGYSVYPFNEETQPYRYSAWMMQVPMAVPEPGVAGLMAVGAAFVVRRWRTTR